MKLGREEMNKIKLISMGALPFGFGLIMMAFGLFTEISQMCI